MSYRETAEAIYKHIGPADNIIAPYNCMTRLRFSVKEEHFTKEDLLAVDGVKGVAVVGSGWQIILGPGKAQKVTAELKAITAAKYGSESLRDLAAKATVGDGADLREAIRKRNTATCKEGLKKISRIFIPVIPAFIACGLITGILNSVGKIEPALTGAAWFQIAAVAGNAAFWGLNLFIGMSAAREFGGTPVLGGVLAAVVSHPALANITLFGEQLTPGRGGVIAVLLLCFFAATLEKKLQRVIPDMFTLFLTPFLVVVISTVVAVGICQPLGNFLSEAVGTAATTSIYKGGAFTGFILGGTFLPLVLLGVHQGLTPIHADLLARYGATVLLPVLAMAGAGQVGASLAVYAKTKNKALRKTVASALPVGIMGIGEPLIYGVTLPLGKPFIGACIGGACGGAVQAAFGVGAATLGISGLPLAAAATDIPVYLIGLITAYAVGFAAAYLIGFTDPVSPEKEG
ncbi:PTS transporter subunit EIIC [Anaeroglobus geminatus]|uniref:Putative N-acetylmuramic acid phosphotransfer permease n=1 Tax=Anaeroglobus geminatus F0357 TaxID=861450 RepID=G9YK67_9FIRM|nr:PTS transporter subunit EIIC [Anaeroglobus geminatus]EHM37741.1 putative N-acetylmuramic acid phosphotransfer permease [Anaeroglobus geminatus F0357]